MIRVGIEMLLLFLLPAAVYFGYVLLARPTAPTTTVVSEAPLVWLFIAGAVLVGATLLYFSLTATGGSPGKTYTPAHIKDGRVEPGGFK